MKIEYVCHSCVYIETPDTNLIFDPWFNGSAYQNQWQVFPKPLNLDMIGKVRNVLISHGHEDHLHENTLKLFPKDVNMFYPFQWRKGAKKFFRNLGFHQLTEAISFRTYQLSNSTRISYISFALESVIVVEFNNMVIVNINDALNSHHQNVVDVFLKEIKMRWPKIDYLIAGWAGAGYFPNKVRFKTKNDLEVGILREQYFANQLCKIIFELKPKNIIPLLPGFALLQPENLWINEVKFPRNKFQNYYETFFDSKNKSQFHIMLPADVIDQDGLHTISTYHQETIHGELNHLLSIQYKDEIVAAAAIHWIDHLTMIKLLNDLLKLMNANMSLYDKSILETLHFSIIIKNRESNNIFSIFHSVTGFIGEITSEITKDSLLSISTSSDLLFHSIENEWGGDVLTIGYGVEVEVFEEATLELNLDIVCVRLISRFPRTKDEVKKNPMRLIKYYYNNPMLAKLAIKQKLALRKLVNKIPYNERDHWISYTKCELCMVCNLPLLSYEFGENLKVEEIKICKSSRN